MRIHTAWRAEYSQKCTPLPMGPVCGRREASRSFAERGLAHCLAGPGPCRRPLVLWKTPVLASGCVANVRRGAGRAGFVRSRSLGKNRAARIGRLGNQKPWIRGINYWLACPSSMPSRVRQASSAHLTRAGMYEMSWSWAASSRSSRSSSESCSPRIMARKSSARR